MKTVPTPNFRNNLLSRMAPEVLKRLLPFLEYVEMPRHLSLSEPGMASDHSYFLETGIGSIVVSPVTGRKTEIGLFGREGLAPTSGVAGTSSTPYHVFMQVTGSGYRIANIHLQVAMAESVILRNLFARYLQSTSVQIAYTAYSNAVHQIEARLARWLLMCHDRTDGDQIALTHQFIGVMLAVRRQSVTTALHALEGKHLIHSSRGCVIIRNRAGLRELAGESYGVPESEYAANVGGLPSKD